MVLHVHQIHSPSPGSSNLGLGVWVKVSGVQGLNNDARHAQPRAAEPRSDYGQTPDVVHGMARHGMKAEIFAKLAIHMLFALPYTMSVEPSIETSLLSNTLM